MRTSKSKITKPTVEMRVWQVLFAAGKPMLPHEIVGDFLRRGYADASQANLLHSICMALDRLRIKGAAKSGWIIVDEAFSPKDGRKFQPVRPNRRGVSIGKRARTMNNLRKPIT